MTSCMCRFPRHTWKTCSAQQVHKSRHLWRSVAGGARKHNQRPWASRTVHLRDVPLFETQSGQKRLQACSKIDNRLRNSQKFPNRPLFAKFPCSVKSSMAILDRFRIDGKNALMSGAASGLGAPIARALANRELGLRTMESEWTARKLQVNAVAPGTSGVPVPKACQMDEARSRQIL